MLGLFSNPLILIGAVWTIGVVVAVGLRRKSKDAKVPKKIEPKKQKKSNAKVKGPLIKQMQKMESEAGKDKKLSVPPVRSRQEIITEIFASKTRAIGLQASTSSGYIPVSNTPLARFLKERKVPEVTVSAIIEGIMEEETEVGVRELIEAASPELGLSHNELDNAKDLAVQEWRNVSETFDI